MLTQFRNALKGVVAWFVVALLVLAFAFFGIPDLRNFAQSSALQVGETKFSATDVQREFDRQLSLRRQSGEQISREDAIRTGMLTRTLNTMKTRAAINEDARELGLASTTDMVADYLQSIEGLRNPSTGKFDRVVLESILRENNIGVIEFREDVRSDLKRQQIFNSVASTMRAPEAFVTPIILRAAERRDIAYINITAEDIDPIAEPTDEQLRSFYDENSARYTDPEYRTFSVVILQLDDFEEGLEVPEEDIRTLYDLRKSRLDIPEQRSIFQITYPNEADASAAVAKLNTGSSFEDLAKEQSLTIEAVTYENITKEDLLDQEVSNAVFSAPEVDAVVGPVSGVFGYTVAQVTNIIEGKETTFEDQREALVTELLEEQTTNRLLDAIENIEQARDEGSNISEAIAGITEATVTVYGPIDKNLISPDGTIVNDLPVEVLQEAFALDLGDESNVVDLATGDGYFMLSVDDVTPPTLQPFDEVRETVTASWRADQTRKAIEARIDALEAEVGENADFTAIASGAGFNVTNLGLRKFEAPETLPSDLVDRIFIAQLGDLVSDVAQDGQSAIVAQVENATFPPLQQADLLRQIYSENAGQTISNELSDAYVASLQNELGIKQNDAQLASMFSVSEE